MMLYYLLFTSARCSACPMMKESMESLNLGHFNISVDDPMGSALAGKFQVRSLPTMIICRESDEGIPFDAKTVDMELKERYVLRRLLLTEVQRIIGAYKPEKIKEIINAIKKQ